MCGILFALTAHEYQPDDSYLDPIAARGPDSLRKVSRSVQLDTETQLRLTFVSSVLALRGDHVAVQPLVDEETGNILCWNGQASLPFRSRIQAIPDVTPRQVLGGLDVSPEENDTEVLFRTLTERIALARRTQPDALVDTLVVDVFAGIEGPYAFVYYDRYSETIYFARDVFGRRSLLVPRSAVTSQESQLGETIHAFTLASVASIGADRQKPMEELDCRWLWALNLRQVTVHTGESIHLTSAIRKLERLPSGTTSPTFAQIPSLNQTIPAPESRDVVQEGYPKTQESFVRAFAESIGESVKRRVENIPPPKRKGDARLAILFSGGVDCAFITHLANTYVPAGEPIDLLNVAFENPRAIANAIRERAEQQRIAARRKHKGKEKESDGSVLETHVAAVYDVPDRLTGRETVAELRRIHPEREWRFVEIDVEYQECQAARTTVLDLMYPSDTEMDLSLALPLWFAARRRGFVRKDPNGSLEKYQSCAKVLFSGLGADELLGGYARHRRAFEVNGWQGAIDEMQMDLDRLPFRNLGRDDRIISSHGVETRFPYLSLSVAHTLAGLPIHAKCDLRYPEGEGDKSLIRIAANQAGLIGAASKKKRAMQFGTRSARMEPEEKGTKQRGMGAQKIAV